MKRIVVCALAVFSVFIVFGRTSADSVKVYFNISRGHFDPLLGNNAASMDSFIHKIRMAVDAHELGHVAIKAYASPDGPLKLNIRLAEERSKAIADYIISKTGIGADSVRVSPEGVAWDELRRMVAADSGVPSRMRVLDVLDNTPLWIYDSKGRVVDGRKRRLMSLAGGVPYRWMLTHIFPRLRHAFAVSVYLKKDEPAPLPDVSEPDTVQVDTADTVVPDALERVTVEKPDTVVAPSAVAPEEAVARKEVPPYCLALKTNILYYAALMPNLELEWLASKRWSVAVEGNVAWWGDYSRNKSYRMAIITPEVRHWIKPRAPWHGMYVGLFAGGGWYDLENGGTGYYGEGVMGGASFGYMWPIGKRLSLEAALGAGYMHTRFKEYEPYEGHHVYQRTKSLDYFGPLKLKFSIAWRFLERSKSKRIKPEI